MNDKTLKVLEYKKIIDSLQKKAESHLGREKIKNIKPLTDKKKVEQMLMETEEALSLLIKRGNPPLFGIHNISQEIRRVQLGGFLSPAGLLKIADTLRVSRALKKYIKETKEEETESFPLIEGLIEGLRVYSHIEKSINRAIIDEEEIADNASTRLKNIRRQIARRNNEIKDKLNSIITSPTYKKHLQDSIVTVREGRYVVPVKQESRGSVPGLVHDISASGATVFIEPMAVVDLNNQLRELEIKEREEIEKILADLSNLVATEATGIFANQEKLQNLDFIFAKGKLALEMDATRPLLNDKGYINLKRARHPLLDPKEVVPIDVYLGKEFTSLIITGPNTGGKTVSLKTVGLLTLMAQSGLHIPADFNSELAVFDQVFADIGDEQSIEQSLSTFSSHMTNIVDILNRVEDNSLILFDELGAGTDPTEGAALAMAILDYLLKKDVRTIATTHYSQLKLYALTTDKVRNASVEFDVETLRPTFRLLIGVPGKSNAFEISQRLGLQSFIIDYARELISKENIEFEDVLQAIDKDRRQTEEAREEAEKLRKDIKELKRDLAREKEKTEDMRGQLIREARQEARDILRQAKKEADQIVAELRKASAQVGRERNRKIQQAQDRLK
ncbi:MAG TPA: endonuclease MutS2, partial [Tissierellaceae bacterium]|nr:endonuclease MutS2 [Tissierellaceae bacterium]